MNESEQCTKQHSKIRKAQTNDHVARVVGKTKTAHLIYKQHVGGHQAGFNAGSKLTWHDGVSGASQGRLA